MIVFDRLWDVMKEKNISTYQLREKCGIDSKTVRRLRANDNMETKTLNMSPTNNSSMGLLAQNHRAVHILGPWKISDRKEIL